MFWWKKLGECSSCKSVIRQMFAGKENDPTDQLFALMQAKKNTRKVGTNCSKCGKLICFHCVDEDRLCPVCARTEEAVAQKRARRMFKEDCRFFVRTAWGRRDESRTDLPPTVSTVDCRKGHFKGKQVLLMDRKPCASCNDYVSTKPYKKTERPAKKRKALARQPKKRYKHECVAEFCRRCKQDHCLTCGCPSAGLGRSGALKGAFRWLRSMTTSSVRRKSRNR